MKRSSWLGMAAALALAAGATASIDQLGQIPAGGEELGRIYPGVQFGFDQGRVRTIYGVPMTPGATPAQAAAMFLRDHSGAFGVGQADLRQTWSADLGNGRHTVFAYQQYLGGLPVEYGIARVLVLKGPLNRVVYAAGTLSPPPAAGFPKMRVDAPTALALVQTLKQYTHLKSWTQPQLVVYQGEGQWVEPVRCWKFSGEEPDPNIRENWTFFVDAATGSVVHVRDEILHNDVTGTARGKGTPDLYPDETGHAPTLQPLPYLNVSITGGNSAFTDLMGNFSITNPGTAPVMLTGALGPAMTVGRWASVQDTAAATISFTQNATPGTPASIVLNNTPNPPVNSFTTAQVNAYIYTNKIHDYYRDRSGTWNRNDTVIRVNVNLNQTCNAFFDGSSTNFFRSGGQCPNTAYSDVVCHEYGHWIVQLLGLGQGGFGEGFADTGPLLLLDEQGRLGRDFLGPNTYVRDVIVANQQYPCNAEAHTCGQILGGVWWGIRVNMGTAHGTAGLEMTRQLEVDWMLITTGGAGPGFNNSASPTTAIEVLTVDDDDGILGNGTPNYASICPSFSHHNISCPPAPPLNFSFPNGLPTLIQPNTPYDIAVNVDPLGRNPAPHTGMLHYRLNNGQYQVLNMTDTTPNRYHVTVPAQPCNTNIEYYFTAMTTAPAVTATNPATAPASPYYVGVANSLNSAWTDDFETDRGWSGVAMGDDATTGRWTRNVPQPTGAQPGTDHTPLGVQCWVTDYRAGLQISDFDVDNGHTTLTSPRLDLTGLTSPRISYWRWYSNDVGLTNPNTNVFYVDISNDDGVSWRPVERVGPAGIETDGGWFQHGFNVDYVIPITNQMRVRFIAEDITDSIVEAAVDDFAITSLVCGSACYANCDGSTSVPFLNVNDFLCFQTKFAAGDTYANCDNSTLPPVLNVNDYICFQTKFSAGCSAP